MADSPYPELKKTHTIVRMGRPWRDRKPPPSAGVWGIIQGFGSYWTLVAAIDLGVFDAVERMQPIAVNELARDLRVSLVPLSHLLDALVGLGFCDQVDDMYELTETAERYLTSNGPASMAALVRDAPGPHHNWTRLAETIRSGEVAVPIENDMAGFYGPLVQATFPTQLRASSRLGLRLGWARRPNLRVLDLGAGLAPWAIGVLEQSPGSTAVVNDIPIILDMAKSMIAEHGLTDRVEFRAGNFHQIEIEENTFDIVVLGNVCRTEGDALSRSLVTKAHGALKIGGSLLLADYFADKTRKFNPFGVQMGLTMLANTLRGGMITSEQVVGWLTETGFGAIRLIEPIGVHFVYVADKLSPTTLI
jgi:SAM-dependent methyltransferase